MARRVTSISGTATGSRGAARRAARVRRDTGGAPEAQRRRPPWRRRSGATRRRHDRLSRRSPAAASTSLHAAADGRAPRRRHGSRVAAHAPPGNSRDIGDDLSPPNVAMTIRVIHSILEFDRRVSLVACAGAASRTSSLGCEYNWLPVPGLPVELVGCAWATNITGCLCLGCQ